MDVRRVLRDVRKLRRLTAVMWFHLLPYRGDQRVLIGEKGESAALDEIPEVARGEVGAE